MTLPRWLRVVLILGAITCCVAGAAFADEGGLDAGDDGGAPDAVADAFLDGDALPSDADVTDGGVVSHDACSPPTSCFCNPYLPCGADDGAVSPAGCGCEATPSTTNFAIWFLPLVIAIGLRTVRRRRRGTSE